MPSARSCNRQAPNREPVPGSKFVLTVRPTDKWMASQAHHFGTRTTPMRQWLYGVECPHGNEDVHIARYDRHNSEVREHFKDRPQNMIEMQFERGDGSEKLCRLLDVPVPDQPWRRANAATVREHREKGLFGRVKASARASAALKGACHASFGQVATNGPLAEAVLAITSDSKGTASGNSLLGLPGGEGLRTPVA